MMNFGAIEGRWTRYSKARFVVLPVPYDLTSTYGSGSRLGPAAILTASANMELYDEQLGREIYEEGIFTAPALEVEAGGPDRMIAAVRRAVASYLADGKVPVLLGGEHSVTLGAVQAAREAFPGIRVLHLDAHADLRDSYQGTPFSHACVARRVREVCPLVEVGIRSMSAEEARFARREKVEIFGADFLHDDPRAVETIASRLEGDVYVTVDLDCLDPAVMPSTGTPEPGGLTWRQVTSLIRAVAERCAIRGFDVVELAPLPGMVAPDFLAARLVYRIMGYISQFRPKKGG